MQLSQWAFRLVLILFFGLMLADHHVRASELSLIQHDNDSDSASHKIQSEDSDSLYRQALDHFYQGESAAGLQLATAARQIAPANAKIQFAVTIGLMQTQQNERLVAEGLNLFRVDALDALGQRDEAFELAQKLANEGYPRPLFTLYNRANRSQELVDYIEARWSTIRGFASDHPHDDNGYGLMAQVALAYSRSSNIGRFDEAVSLVEKAISTLSNRGTDNMVFVLEKAVYLSLAGHHADAIRHLEDAVDRGLRGNPALDRTQPVFAPLAKYARFAKVRDDIGARVNEQRMILGLEPLTW